ncbi:Uncharacterized protein {ECO:0000313/EMBL:CCF08203.1} [Pantoea ananatis]|nr:hypothetical protein PANA5342_0810 [Pantoea ananatis LMG 5342]CRH30736.1 Uncharacterized protein {ECO:0000313/EMBL:CCF08203.1} [Pantoea ananatis]CRH35491.1 Uncharacterized protein BN1183_CH_00280 [Pantoea ananatis]
MLMSLINTRKIFKCDYEFAEKCHRYICHLYFSLKVIELDE